MTDRAEPIARIRLSRSLARLLVLPSLALLAGAAAIAAGLLAIPGTAGLVVAGLGGVVTLASLVAAAALLSIRLEIEEAAVRVTRLGGGRMYGLIPGPVTRVRFRGDNPSSLRASPRFLPWQLGRAVLRHEEAIEVVRLAPTPTAILVPTDRGRLAIAAANEEALLEALSLAARARQRLEELAREAPPEAEPEPQPEPEPQAPPVELDPALMTGIERALHERRLAEARDADALLAEERAAAVVEAEEPSPSVEQPPVPAAERRGRLRLPRPSWTARPGPSAAIFVLPLIAAGAAWGAALLLDRMPPPGTELGRITALALVLAGPVTTVAAIMARVYWPRIAAVVIAGGLATALFVGRALLG